MATSHKTYWGTIRAFYTDRGFGFIIPDDGTEDVFMHRSVLGPHLLIPGARVEYTFHHVAGRKRCNGVYTVEKDGETLNLNIKPIKESDWTGARVKMYDIDRGFGFVELGDRTGDAFFHWKWIEEFATGAPKPGDLWRVRYRRDTQMRAECIEIEIIQLMEAEEC